MNQLNLPEFKVIEVQENDYDILFTVEAVEPPKCCPECGSVSYYKHGKVERFVRDLNAFGKRVGINIQGNRYKCRDCEPPVTFSETYESIDERDKMTIRLREHIKLLSLKQPFSNIAEEYSISPTTVKRIFNEYIEQNERLMVFKPPRVLGIDEVHLNKQMRAVFTDIEDLKILDMLPDRNKQTIINFLKKVVDKRKIEFVTTDMWQPYKDAINEVLPHAKQIVDKFHVSQYGTKAMEDSRKAFRKTLTDKQRKQLMHDRFILLKNKEDLKPQEQWNLQIWFATFPTLKVTYNLIKEGLRDMYLCETREQAEEYFKEWKKSIPEDMTSFLDIAKMINNWHTEIFNYFDNRLTNAFTESINNLIKHIEKRGRGYSFEVLRAKVLFGTKATTKPRFGEQAFTRMDKFNMTMYGSFDYTPPTLEEGFGVSIPQLLEVIERDDF
jgi:transposase